MGQAESYPKSEYQLDNKREKLIQQYSGVDIDSIHSDTLAIKGPKVNTEKESVFANTFIDEPYNKFLINNGDEDNNIIDLETFGLDKRDRITQNKSNFLIVERKYSTDFDSANTSRKSSRDFDSAREHNSSSEKIFCEHAEYANDLLNAPYNLTTKYTSLETVNSKDQEINSNLEFDINEKSGDSRNSSKSLINTVIEPPTTRFSDLENATYTNVPVYTLPSKIDLNQHKLNDKTQPSVINALKDKFEKELPNASFVKKSSSQKENRNGNSLHIENDLLEQESSCNTAKDNHVPINETASSKTNPVNQIPIFSNTHNSPNIHERLSRRKAAILHLSDLYKDQKISHLDISDPNNQNYSAPINVNESLNTNSDNGDSEKLKLTPTLNHKFKKPSASVSNSNTDSSHVNVGVPNILTIKKAIDSKSLSNNIKGSDERDGVNALVVCNGKPKLKYSVSSTIVGKPTIDIPENKPRVASLRRKFEEFRESDNSFLKSSKFDKPHLSYLKTHWIPLKSDSDFEQDKYPVVKSKSDSHIKFAAKDKVHQEKTAASADSDGIYEEYAVRTSFRKSNTKETGKGISSPVIIKKSKYKIDSETTLSEYEDYLNKTLKTSSQKERNTNKNHARTPSPKLKNRILRKNSHKESLAKQTADTSVEVHYDDCVVVEPQKDQHSKDKIPSQSEDKDPGKEPTKKVMDFHRSKKESKRHRRKSDSSTSNLSDSSTPVTKSSKKWKKSKEKEKLKKKNSKKDENDDAGLSQQWGSMITEYQEKYVTSDNGNQKSYANNDRRTNKLANMEQYNNVKQVFNRGMVLPVKRAPPGMSAQEVESDSGVTDYSTHSWTAMHRPIGIRAHVDGAAYNTDDGQTFIKQRIDDSFSSSAGMQHEQRIHPTRTRFSSQSSQYTSDAPMSPGRQRKPILSDINNHYQKQHNVGFNQIPSGHRGITRHSSSYSDRPITPEAYHHSRLSRHYSDYPSSPEVPRQMRLVKQTISHSSDGAMSPAVAKKFRTKSLPREPFVNSANERHIRENSMSRERLDYGSGGRHYEYSKSLGMPHTNQQHIVEYTTNSLGRPQQHYQNRARSMSRDRLNNTGVHRNIQKRSMSSDRLDYIRPSSPSLDRKLRHRTVSRQYLEPYDERDVVHHEYNKKSYKKKTMDQKAKNFVDTVIDEAIDRFTLSPKSKRKSKSRDNLSSKTNHKNVVNTTNIYNEYIEDESNLHDEERWLDRKAYSDVEDYRMYDDRRGMDNFEHDLRSYNSVQRVKPSLLRPQPIDTSVRSERRSCIRPVAGSGITRDGNIPPPKSAYKNYDFELSVGPFQYGTEERPKKEKKSQHHYTSESEYSTTLDSKRRHQASSQYPHISFGPTRAKSEENLLSESIKSSYNVPQKHSVSINKRNKHVNVFEENEGFDSDPEDKKKFNPPTLTRGMVTKIMHKLDEDINKLSSLRGKSKSKKRQQLDLNMIDETDNYVTNTWPRNETDHVKADITESQIGATLYGTLPSVSSHSTQSSASANSFYLHPLDNPNGPLQTSSPVTHNLSVHNNKVPVTKVYPGTLPAITVQDHQQIQREVSSNLDHARFKMYHGEPMKVHPNNGSQSLTMQMGNESSNIDIQKLKPIEENQEARYGAFSNENMIVADLIANQGIMRPTNGNKHDNFQVRKVGQLFGTQPDVSMNKQQTLNFYLFNQSKSGDETEKQEAPRISYMARNVEYNNHGKKQHQQTDLFINEDVLSSEDSDTELREYLIHHKQTQTMNASQPRKTKKKKEKQYIVVQRSPPPPKKQQRKHVETTHYITQEREIERIPPQKESREMWIQTDKEEQAQIQYIQQPQYTVGRVSPPPRQHEHIRENIVEQSSFINRPVITQSRHMEKHNYEPPSVSTSRSSTPPPSPQMNIPIMVQPDWNQSYMEKIEKEYQHQNNIVPVVVESNNMAVAVESDDDDDETVILETTEIEEREQRIAMAIFEEIEFSASRTEGGKTVTLDGSSEIPNFWDPDKYEAVVDRKKKKMTQIKETNQEQGGKRSKHPVNQYAIEDRGFIDKGIAIEDGGITQMNYIEQSGQGKKSKLSDENGRQVNTQPRNEMSEEITEKIAALDKVLEDELAKDEQAVDEPDVVRRNVKSNTKPNKTGEPITDNYVNYEKVVDIRDNTSPTHIPILPNPPQYGDMYKSSRTVNLSPQLSKKKMSSSFRSHNPVKNSTSWNTSYDAPYHSPTLSQRIKNTKSSYQHTPLEPMFITERGNMYGKTAKIKHNQGIPVRSYIDPNNVTFSKKSTEQMKESEEFNNELQTFSQKKKSAPPTPPPAPTISGLNGQTVHSEQSEPIQQTHYEEDQDGNLLKVTEWQHKLSKTIEYPDEEDQNRSTGQSRRNSSKSKSINELPEAGYIKMNLHETISSSERPDEHEAETTADESESLYKMNNIGPEVVGETEVGVKPFHYESKQNSLKVDDDPEISKERQFLYDIKKAKLKPVPKAYQNGGWGRKFTYGTMSTHL